MLAVTFKTAFNKSSKIAAVARIGLKFLVEKMPENVEIRFKN